MKKLRKRQMKKKNIKKKKIHVNLLNMDKSKISEIAKKESIYFNPNKALLLDPCTQILIKIRNNKIIDIQHDFNSNNRNKILLKFLNEVLEDSTYRIHGDFIFQIGDKSDENNINEIVFSKNINTQKSLMPDCYAMNNYGNIIHLNDDKPFFLKKKRGYFIGTSTGSFLAQNNERLFYSNYSKKNKCLFDCEINHICQIPAQEVKNVYPNFHTFVTNQRKSIEEQRSEYRYILDIDGNTCSWDRIVWIMKSNCICLKKKSENINWYYPLLEKNKYYYEFNSPEELNTLIQKLNKMSKKNRILIRKNIRESKHFVSTYLSKSSHLHYFGQLLHYISEKFEEN